jgi:acyl dehydratase
VGETLRLRLTIAGIEQTRAGELVRLEGEALRQGERVGSARLGLMVRGRRRRRGSGGSRREERTEAFRLPLPTAADQALRYAAASGDTNFIHTSPTLARLVGLPGTILHGMCVLAMSSAALVRHRLGGDLLRCRGLRARFSYPARPGEPLTIVGFPGDLHRIPFEVRNAGERAVIRGGELLLRG